MMKRYLFRNDYSSSAHPRVLEAVCAVNLEGNHGYGDDGYTARAREHIQEVCGCLDAAVELLIDGTQTNVVACSFLLKSQETAIYPGSGHLNGHGAGAFEATDHKILPVPVGGDGEITPEMLPPLLALHRDSHLTKPGLVYISNATKDGAVYTKTELTVLYAFCRENGLLLLVDGAQLRITLTSEANDLTLPGFTRLCDTFYIGDTKNGVMFGEALVITRPELTDGFFHMKKRMGAVMEKGWIQGAMFQTLFTDSLYFHMTRHTNEMAAHLQNGLRARGWMLWVDSPINQMFAVMGNTLKPQLDAVCDCKNWCPYDGSHTVVRLVTCFQTSQEDVGGLLAVLPGLYQAPLLPRGQASGEFFCLFHNQTASASYILIEPILGEEGSKLDETTLVKKLRRGSRLALKRAIDRFTLYMSTIVVRVLAGQGAREGVEELTVDVFLALQAHAGESNPEQDLRPWLEAVVRDRAADWLRTHKEVVPLPEGTAASGGADPQAKAERQEQAARLWDAVEGLDEPDRALFLRCYYCGDRLEDIARALDLTQTAAKQRLFRGRKTLRDTLTKGGVKV